MSKVNWLTKSYYNPFLGLSQKNLLLKVFHLNENWVWKSKIFSFMAEHKKLQVFCLTFYVKLF